MADLNYSLFKVFEALRSHFNKSKDENGNPFPMVINDIENVRPKYHKDTNLKLVALTVLMMEHNKTRNKTYQAPKGLPKKLPTVDNLKDYDFSNGVDQDVFAPYIKYCITTSKRGKKKDPLLREACYVSIFIRYLAQLQLEPIALVPPVREN